MSDLVAQGSQVPLKAFMFTLQGLHAGQVMAVVVGVKSLVLLLDPLFSFICIPAHTSVQLWSRKHKGSTE